MLCVPGPGISRLDLPTTCQKVNETVTARPRVHGGGDGSTPERHGASADAPSRVHGIQGAATSVDQAHQGIAQVAGLGRAGAGRNVAGSGTDHGGSGNDSGTHGPTPDDILLQEIVRRHEQLGDEPPSFNIATNDDAHGAAGAHTIDRHGPQLPLPRQPGVKTVEGRIFGETGWDRTESKSYKWTDASTMNREVNRYVRENWETIRDDLAFDGFHESLFDAGHRVGQGYYNKGMYGAGPRQAAYGETSLVRLRIRVVEGSDPAVPFIVSAFPAGLG